MREAYFPEAKTARPTPKTSSYVVVGNVLLSELPDAPGILSTSHTRVQCLVKKKTSGG